MLSFTLGDVPCAVRAQTRDDDACQRENKFMIFTRAEAPLLGRDNGNWEFSLRLVCASVATESVDCRRTFLGAIYCFHPYARARYVTAERAFGSACVRAGCRASESPKSAPYTPFCIATIERWVLFFELKSIIKRTNTA